MEKINFKKVIDVALRKKTHVISIILIFVILGVIYTYNFVKEAYISSTTFLLGVPTAVTEDQTIEEETTPVVRTSLRIDSQTVSTYNELVKSNTSIKQIKDNLNIDIDNEILKRSITVTRAQKSDVIKIIVKYTDKQIASNIANETVKVFSERIKEIYKMSEIYIIDEAVPSEKPYNVNHVRDIIIFTLIGFIVSLLYCELFSIFDKTIKSQETIEEDLGIKVLASIPNRKSKKQALEKLIDFQKEKSPVLKEFENLKMNVQFTNINNKSNKVMLVTSCFSTEGKSYVASNLAAVFAKAGKKVIVIDMDMRAGRQASIFGTPNNLGISNYLSNIDTNGMEINERINSYIKETSIKNLNVITSGTVPPNASDLLTSEKLPELIKDLSVFYDLIIFDGAPILPVPDSLILSRMAGSTILVSLANKTKKEDLRKAKKDLQNIGGRIIGVVFNESSIQDKAVKKAYFKLESSKIENTKKKIDLKEKALKIKTWISNHVVFYKKKGEQLLLGQQEESAKDLNSKISNKEEKENTAQEENAELKKEVIDQSIKEEHSKEQKVDNSNTNIEDVKNTQSKIKENIISAFKRVHEKLKEFYQKVNSSFKKMQEKLKETLSKKNQEIKEKQESRKVVDKKENKEEIVEKNEKNKEELAEVSNEMENKIENNEENFKTEDVNKEVQKENQEKEITEKEIIAEEKRKQKELLKQERKQEKINFKKEKRRKRREKLKMQQEEARIQEELLEDNLYPKTKYNKNL